MKRFPSVGSLTPAQFEQQVRAWLEAGSGGLEEFTSKHQDCVPGPDGEYSFDVTARFTAFGGARFVVVVECKRHNHPIKRDVVQILRQKQLSTGAHKALVVATAKFQSGAIEFAAKHGVGLIEVVNGQVRYIQASATPTGQIPENAEDFVGLFYGPNPDGRLVLPELVSSDLMVGFASYLCNVD
jgi:HJR/Mrr/RecB family endonuclease